MLFADGVALSTRPRGRATVRSCSSEVSTNVPPSSSQKSRIAVSTERRASSSDSGVPRAACAARRPSARRGSPRQKPGVWAARHGPSATAGPLAHEHAGNEADEPPCAPPRSVARRGRGPRAPRREGQPVPCRELLVVARRPDLAAPAPRAAHCGRVPAGRRRPLTRRCGARCSIPPSCRSAVTPSEWPGPRSSSSRPAVVRTDMAPRAPDVEAALDALGVGVQGGGEPAVLGPELGEHEVEGPARDPGVPLDRPWLGTLEVGVGEQRVVVEHLLEVRHEPVRVGAVAVRSRRRAGRRCRRRPSRSSVRVTISSVSADRIAATARRRNSRSIGAETSARRRSRRERRRSWRRRAPAASSWSALRASIAGRAGELRTEVVREHRACCSTCARCVRYASATAVRTRGNPGMPCRSSGGKYVPPKNGRRSGVRNTLIGQPPEPVIACTAVM